MTGLADFLMNDDDGQLLRSIMRRIDTLEFARSNDVPSGAIVGFPGQIRGSKWSSDRLVAVGSKYSSWYRLNDLSEAQVYEEAAGLPASRATLAGTGTDPRMGQPGGMRSEGGYSVGFSGAGTKYLVFPATVTGARNWTMEAIFRPDSLPVAANVFQNGSSGGQAIYIQTGGGSPGSKLSLLLAGVAWYDTGVTLVARDWYHVIYVSDSADNTVKWYVGRFNVNTQQFTFTTGSMAVAAATPVASGLGVIGSDFPGLVDEALVYNGKLTAAEAEDRIRCALMPGPPAGWVAADGGIVARQKYPNLFTRIGIAYSAGDGSTTFGLPNVPGSIVKV
jgi:hypothetical protein